MTIMTGVFRLGHSAEVRYLPSGDPVATLSLAYNYGKKGEDGKRPTQWVEAGLWGSRAETLAPMLPRGRAIYVVLEDVRIDTWTKKDGTIGHKLVGRVASLELVGPAPEGDSKPAEGGAPTPARAPARTSSRPAAAASMGDLDDDIPF
jgi:single-strand DNA-binding protein